MPNTVAHIKPKPGTSRRLGLCLPKRRGGRVRAAELIVGPAAVWDTLDTAMRREAVDTSARLFDATFPAIGTDIPVPLIHIRNVTATRRGEPVHVSEVIKDLMTNMGLVPRPAAEPSDFVTLTGTECCDTMHVFNFAASSWLPGCAHLGSV